MVALRRLFDRGVENGIGGLTKFHNVRIIHRGGADSINHHIDLLDHTIAGGKPHPEYAGRQLRRICDFQVLDITNQFFFCLLDLCEYLCGGFEEPSEFCSYPL